MTSLFLPVVSNVQLNPTFFPLKFSFQETKLYFEHKLFPGTISVSLAIFLNLMYFTKIQYSVNLFRNPCQSLVQPVSCPWVRSQPSDTHIRPARTRPSTEGAGRRGWSLPSSPLTELCDARQVCVLLPRPRNGVKAPSCSTWLDIRVGKKYQVQLPPVAAALGDKAGIKTFFLLPWPPGNALFSAAPDIAGLWATCFTPGPSRSSPEKLLSSWLAPVCTCVQGFSSPAAGLHTAFGWTS